MNDSPHWLHTLHFVALWLTLMAILLNLWGIQVAIENIRVQTMGTK